MRKTAKVCAGRACAPTALGACEPPGRPEKTPKPLALEPQFTSLLCYRLGLGSQL